MHRLFQKVIRRTPNGKIVAYEVNAGNVGRNADELFRKVQASQFVYEHGDEVCPAKWQPGAETLKPSLYLARAKYRVLVVEKERFGGQITITAQVVNFPGVYETSGRELTETMQKQAESFGAEFMLAEVTGFDLTGKIRKVITSRGEFSCFGILLATGAHPRKIGFEGEEEFKGHGWHTVQPVMGSFLQGKKCL